MQATGLEEVELESLSWTVHMTVTNFSTLAVRFASGELLCWFHFITMRLVSRSKALFFFLHFSFLDGGRNAELPAAKSTSGRWGSLPEPEREWLSRLTDREQCHIPAEAPPSRPLLLLHTQQSFPPFRPPVSHPAGPFRGPNQTAEEGDFIVIFSPHSICSYQKDVYCRSGSIIIHLWHKQKFKPKRTPCSADFLFSPLNNWWRSLERGPTWPCLSKLDSNLIVFALEVLTHCIYLVSHPPKSL